MSTRKSLLAVVGAATLGVLIAASAHAWDTQHTNYLTFSGPVALPGVTLTPGTYLFRSPIPTNRDIVQVLNRNGSRAYFMGMTQPVSRTPQQRGRMVIVGEAAPGLAPPIKAWFPIGQDDGHAFVYDR